MSEKTVKRNRNEYIYAWYRSHPGKRAEHNRRYWERKIMKTMLERQKAEENGRKEENTE